MNPDTDAEDRLVDELNDNVDELFTRLAGIECTAHGDGIATTVNLDGRLTGLTLSATAVTLPPDELAAEIFRLTQEASATALAEGLGALTPVAGEELTARLRAEIDAHTSPAPRAGDDDFTPATWAVGSPGT
ncbi:hypothetical protein [Actinophytocola sediminis]